MKDNARKHIKRADLLGQILNLTWTKWQRSAHGGLRRGKGCRENVESLTLTLAPSNSSSLGCQPSSSRRQATGPSVYAIAAIRRQGKALKFCTLCPDRIKVERSTTDDVERSAVAASSLNTCDHMIGPSVRS